MTNEHGVSIEEATKFWLVEEALLSDPAEPAVTELEALKDNWNSPLATVWEKLSEPARRAITAAWCKPEND